MTKNKMGRPRIEIDKTRFEALCRIQCTLVEISSVLGCSEDTVERWCKRTYNTTFAEAFKKNSAGGRASLRRKMHAVAMEGSIPMLIFLGKSVLGLSDSPYNDGANEKYETPVTLKAVKK